MEGLRTLVLAKKLLTADEVRSIFERFQNIAISNDPNKDEKLANLFDDVEKGFDFIGTSAVEDKLQEVNLFISYQGVPETIEFLLQAGIRVWVLTGDKKVK